MEITFRDKHLQKLCCEESTARKDLGSNRAKRLRVRLSELHIATNLSELVNGRPHPLSGDRAHQFSLDLDGPMRLIVESDDPTARRADGSTDWARVRAVVVVALEDTHG